MENQEQAIPGKSRSRHFVTVNRAEQWWVDKARLDPVFFQHYLLEKEPAKHHLIWLANFFHPTRTRINLIAPRDSAKTTVAVVAMCYQMGRNPISTNGIISVSSDQAKKRLNMIKGIIQDHPRFKNVFPDVYVDDRLPSTQSEFSLYSTKNGMPYSTWRRYVAKYGSLKDPTMRAAGVGGRAIIGSRISGILLLDDIIDEESLTEAAQDDAEQYVMQTLEPTVKDSGKMVYIGTRWMLNDVPARLMRNPEYHTIQIPATLYDEEGNAYSYWPDYWPLEKLAKKRATIQNDAIYFIQYENDPRAMTKSLFTVEDMNRNLPEKMPALASVYITTDLAVSLLQAADFTVYQAWGIDFDNNCYLLDMRRMKIDIHTALDELVRFSKLVPKDWGMLNNVLIENVAFQSVFQQLLAKIDPYMPTFGVVPRGDKGHRATFVSDWSRRGKIFIRQTLPDIEILKSEWMNFDKAPHDDTLDPAGLLFQHLNIGISSVEESSVYSEFLL